ncbi:methyl-accepting chemotaxis protein [Gilvimarinus agarilyticus]|uniref:methyl-accepting chemotaxis protein n=1 Tax=unclassified Gilvimarinus TaxID=2642066 RepID=UPI001C0A5E24|nr:MULTISPECIES: methyl-accepting chemotaxis protein [unclassified Gilvimarinus]MBU2885921.1 methyl-accepting chemotaxis protein [Gilvimarinus agarilyticus]MDO6570667.1 methyl-accepting chemotaxis protein [Gilvimarinus sp. 2_MG-2023]MDO6747742.1 methyl-accepting chemotaxis protein [Gilvimarinus sp. 1_MG-2023]
MMLQSERMQLSSAERRWLGWWGGNGKLSLSWSCWVNRSRYALMEQAFESIANTRIRIMHQWVESQWRHMQGVAARFEQADTELAVLLPRQRQRMKDCSELFVVSAEGEVLASTFAEHVGQRDVDKKALGHGLTDIFLHGPYVDRLTERIGPSSSKFHDAVTLMFYLPITLDSGETACLCARYPNDVLSDLIQREAGHIFTESGDNYLFMVESKFDKRIASGTALSRSRFEDDTFSHGENLKSGIHTGFGVVKVREHTEFEIHFTDPATGQLHPGVRETIKNGNNLYVTYPGYSDYRHIPVIGKGVTFSLKGSPDTWGMMCEADLEEVYRFRSVTYTMMRLYILAVALAFTGNSLLHAYTSLPLWQINIATGALLLITGQIFKASGPRRLARRIGKMTEMIHTIAEGGGNLRQRLDTRRLAADETGDLGRWTNSFIDNLDTIVGEVIGAAQDVKSNSDQMLDRNEEAHHTTQTVSDSITQMLQLIESQVGEISNASTTADQMKRTMDDVVAAARGQLSAVQTGTQSIRDVVDNSAKTIQSLSVQTTEIASMVSMIGGITEQTNLLALNAAIEAARAGEHGRGFSVVADEVRSLAARTANVADEISQKILSIQTESQTAANYMETSVEEVDRGLRLAEASSSDNTELHEIVANMFNAIQHIEHTSRQSGDRVREVASSSDAMSQVYRVLRGSSDRLQNTAVTLHQLVDSFQVTAR